MDAESGLTPEEQQVAGATVALWNAALVLPDLSADDLALVRQAVHIVQGVLAVRVASRAFPVFWRGREYDKE